MVVRRSHAVESSHPACVSLGILTLLLPLRLLPRLGCDCLRALLAPLTVICNLTEQSLANDLQHWVIAGNPRLRECFTLALTLKAVGVPCIGLIRQLWILVIAAHLRNRHRKKLRSRAHVLLEVQWRITH
jgi:hypothetical protein